LIVNAIKFLDENREGHISISGKRENGYSIYCVEDNGIGIEEKYREKIFELFYRLEPNKSDGEGLGLSIVRQVLGRLDGKIWVESTIGKGSKFYVVLPFSEQSYK